MAAANVEESSQPLMQQASANISWEEKVLCLERKLSLARKKLEKALAENECLIRKLKKFVSDDQIHFLKKGTMRGSHWSNETIRKDLKLRIACGTTGYNVLREIGQPLPSERTLQRRIEDLKFMPGILTELLPSFCLKVESMNVQEREAVLMIDEMSITLSLEFDITTGLIIGFPTVLSSGGNMEAHATHALVFMIGGLSSRWKQTIGYHFTGNSFSPKVVKEVVFDIIKSCETLGLKVEVVVSDMGGHNQGLWKECGITVSKYSQIVNSCDHPSGNSRKLYFMPDGPHILKNIRNHLINNQVFYVADEDVVKNNLPSNMISIAPVKEIFKFDLELGLKLAPQLKDSYLSPTYFEKMKVGLALSLLNHAVAVAIEYAVEKGKLQKSADCMVFKICA